MGICIVVVVRNFRSARCGAAVEPPCAKGRGRTRTLTPRAARAGPSRAGTGFAFSLLLGAAAHGPRRVR